MSKKSVILVVDDDEAVCGVVCRALADDTTQVLDVRSAAEAMEAVRAGLGIDLIITDIRMPGGSGVQLHVDATAAGYRGPWLVMTGQADACELAYFNTLKPKPRVLSKPFGVADLRRVVEEALRCS